MPTIAIIGAGAMGAAVGRRLVANGARVLTAAQGRSAATLARIRDAGMIPADPDALVEAALILSIVPPAEAIAVARGLAPALTAARVKPGFVDCNAIAPATMAQVAAILAETGCAVIDGAIIGAPPRPDGPGPAFHVAGDPDRHTDVLATLGLKLHRIDGPIGAASALKMVYAGINKGLTGLGTAMFLAAERSGAAEGLRAEMADSAPEVLARLTRAIPDMYSKAHRWVAEMHEIADFLGEDDPAAPLYRALGAVYARIAEDRAGDGTAIADLDAALGGRREA
ncbi:NAD(P)-dependent oxidoreductase [Siculibacillus lacustris]|uniref:NAD(P)-dependent oxidoreductase n=1 Tax=Siculibacillus lacustris TaxID=1549641 RepID=A0A4Q9VFL0_9HYPH|nr:NAD(P)-dependent oxidoreductase [Siculibacillus lacustris]TBW33705.1 NAD(P)-dependent oxidoreductase [Siculibacillus lacustris]